MTHRLLRKILLFFSFICLPLGTQALYAADQHSCGANAYDFFVKELLEKSLVTPYSGLSVTLDNKEVFLGQNYETLQAVFYAFKDMVMQATEISAEHAPKARAVAEGFYGWIYKLVNAFYGHVIPNQTYDLVMKRQFLVAIEFILLNKPLPDGSKLDWWNKWEDQPLWQLVLKQPQGIDIDNLSEYFSKTGPAYEKMLVDWIKDLLKNLNLTDTAAPRKIELTSSSSGKNVDQEVAARKPLLSDFSLEVVAGHNDTNFVTTSGHKAFEGGLYFKVRGLRVNNIQPLMVVAADTSGSMRNQGKIEKLKLALKELINSLPDKSAIGIYGFDSLTYLVAESSSLNELERQRLLQASDRIFPDGGTKFGPAIDTICKKVNSVKACVPTVFLLTDGESDDGGEELKKKWLELKKLGIDVHIICFGVEANHSVLSQVAKDLGGQFHYIYSNDTEKIPQLREDAQSEAANASSIEAKNPVKEIFRLISERQKDLSVGQVHVKLTLNDASLTTKITDCNYNHIISTDGSVIDIYIPSVAVGETAAVYVSVKNPSNSVSKISASIEAGLETVSKTSPEKRQEFISFSRPMSEIDDLFFAGIRKDLLDKVEEAVLTSSNNAQLELKLSEIQKQVDQENRFGKSAENLLDALEKLLAACRVPSNKFASIQAEALSLVNAHRLQKPSLALGSADYGSDNQKSYKQKMRENIGNIGDYKRMGNRVKAQIGDVADEVQNGFKLKPTALRAPEEQQPQNKTAPVFGQSMLKNRTPQNVNEAEKSANPEAMSVDFRQNLRKTGNQKSNQQPTVEMEKEKEPDFRSLLRRTNTQKAATDDEKHNS